jgi:hypothetical protein
MSEALTLGPRWAIVRPGKGNWYHVGRVIYVEGAWFELYWHPSEGTRQPNKSTIRKAWAALDLLPGVFWHVPGLMNKLERQL